MKKSKNILIGIVIIVALIILWPIIYFYIKYIFIGGINLKINEINNSKIEQENRDENTKILQRYIEDRYGYVSTLMSIEKVDNAGINSWYVISLPFRNSFTITVDTNKKNIYRDDFYDTLQSDPKFHHLYSEWVKKQVGIDDENVEFGFAGNYDIPYIEFDKITSLSDDYKEIFENTHNLYLNTITVNNYNINEQNYVNCFNKIKNDIYLKCYNITGKPNERYSLFVYIGGYRFIYNYPEEEIANISKKNENPKDYGGAIWSDITQYNNIFK